MTSADIDVTHLDEAVNEFDAAVQPINIDDLGCDTAIPGATVHALVNHVVAGNHLAALLLGGVRREAAQDAVVRDMLGTDHRRAWLESATVQTRAFSKPGVGAVICEHPLADIDGRELLVYRTADLLLHTSDLWAVRGIHWRCPSSLFGVLMSSTALMRRLLEPSAISRLENLVARGPNPGPPIQPQ